MLATHSSKQPIQIIRCSGSLPGFPESPTTTKLSCHVLTKFNGTKFNKINILRWRHNGVSNYQPHDSLLNHLFRRRSKETSRLWVTDLCEGNSPVTSEFPTQRASNAKMFPFHDVIMMDNNVISFLSDSICDTPMSEQRGMLTFTYVMITCLPQL